MTKHMNGSPSLTLRRAGPLFPCGVPTSLHISLTLTCDDSLQGFYRVGWLSPSPSLPLNPLFGISR